MQQNLRWPWHLSPFYSLKPLHLWFSNFICSSMRLQGFRIIKFRLVENHNWPLLLKIGKPLNSTFLPEPLDIFGWNFVYSISWTLIFRIIKMKKKIYSRIRSQWPTFCLHALFCLNANILWNAEQNLVMFSQNDLQMELFQIYVTGQFKIKIAKTWKWQFSRTFEWIQTNIISHKSSHEATAIFSQIDNLK